MSSYAFGQKSVIAVALRHSVLSVVTAALVCVGLLVAALLHEPSNAPVARIGLSDDDAGGTLPHLSLKRRIATEIIPPLPTEPASPPPDTESLQPLPAPVTITPLEELIVRAGPRPKPVAGLPRAPIRKVQTDGPFGSLPIIAADGSRPADVYARPSGHASSQARIAISVGGLGLNRQVTQKAIDALPPEVTLSFVPYAKGLQSWIDKARAAGHETLLEIPMEPYDYPNNDTGPHTLLTDADARENIRRLDYLLSRAVGYFGLANYQGAKFATHVSSLAPVMRKMAERGLVFIHDGAAPRSMIPDTARRTGLDLVVANRIIDAQPEPDAIDGKLLELEALALRDHQALGTSFAFPITVDMLQSWTGGLTEKGFVLVPVSALLKNQPGHATSPS